LRAVQNGGGDLDFTGGKSFKQWVLARDDYDLSRFVFTGLLPTPALNAADGQLLLTVRPALGTMP